MPLRGRIEVDGAQLATIMRPFLVKKRWLSCGEKLSGPVDRLMVQTHKERIGTFAEIFGGNLSTRQSTMFQAFEILAEENGDKWHLNAKQRKDWSLNMSRRARTMLRHVSQALLKKSKWAKELFGSAVPSVDERPGDQEEPAVDDDDDDDDQDPGNKDDDEPAINVIAEFSFEHHEAWRKRVPEGKDMKSVRKEWTRDIFANKNEADDACMWARWPDGEERPLPELLASQWHDIQQSSQKRRKPEWQGTRAADGARVTVSYRSERPGQAIFVISANGKQVTQILLHRFGDESLQQVRDEAKAAAIKLAEMYTAENLEKATLILRRDSLLPPKIVKKRPSSGAQHVPSSAKKKQCAAARADEDQVRTTELDGDSDSGADALSMASPPMSSFLGMFSAEGNY